MTYPMTRAEVEAVFVEMDLPLIERGIDEIQAAKDRLMGLDQVESDDVVVVRQVVVSGGTGKPMTKVKHAELEPSPL